MFYSTVSIWLSGINQSCNKVSIILYNFLNIIIMMQSFLACFACGDKGSSSVVAPEPVDPSQIKVTRLNQSQIKTDDNKSRISMTTVTFLTSQTAPSKEEDDDEEIRRRIQMLRKKELPQRKAMESEFVRQNLTRSTLIYLIDKKWSEEYTKFLKSQKVTTMGPIDNQKLMDSKNQLRLNIKQKQDYFIVTQKIWKFVHGLYGGGPTIARDSTFPVFNIVSRKVGLQPVAIQNPLNLCFMISVIQMLLSNEHLNGYMLKKIYNDASNTDGRKKTLHNALFKLLKQYSDTQSNPIDSRVIQIKQFSSNFQNRFDPEQQHDAHQFLLYFAELLQEEMKVQVSTSKAENNAQSIYSYYFRQHKSIIDRIFAGQQQTIITCLSCQAKSNTYVPFLQIVLSIVGLKTIEQCLQNYYSSQKLQDLYQCESCNKKCKATKSTCITKTPNYLVIVLGKFSISTQKKIQDRIQYGMQLNLRKYCYGHCGDTNYILQSMIIHKGARSNKGHYYTIARRGQKNEWFLMNDASSKEIDEKQVLGRDPYILIYQRYKNS